MFGLLPTQPLPSPLQVRVALGKADTATMYVPSRAWLHALTSRSSPACTLPDPLTPNDALRLVSGSLTGSQVPKLEQTRCKSPLHCDLHIYVLPSPAFQVQGDGWWAPHPLLTSPSLLHLPPTAREMVLISYLVRELLLCHHVFLPNLEFMSFILRVPQALCPLSEAKLWKT